MNRLVDRQGHIYWGHFAEPVDIINYRDYVLRTPMGRRLGTMSKHFRVHQFNFFGFMGPGLIGGVAVVDLRYLSSAFAYVYDRERGELRECSVRSPGRALIRPTPERPSSIFHSRRLHAAITAATVRVSAPDFTVDIRLAPCQPDPLRLCTRCGYRGWQFTRKQTPLDLDGRVELGGRVVALSSPDCRGLSDWSGGFMRRETCWNWAACAATLPDGRGIGFNLACEVNETGYTENVLVVDGTATRLDAADFRFDEDDLTRPWRVTTEDGRIELEFRVEARHAEAVNVLLVATRFSQLMGRFSGRAITAAGETIEFRDLPGFVEDHYAKW